MPPRPTLFLPISSNSTEGAHFAHHITTRAPGLSDLPTALCVVLARRVGLAHNLSNYELRSSGTNLIKLKITGHHHKIIEILIYKAIF